MDPSCLVAIAINTNPLFMDVSIQIKWTSNVRALHWPLALQSGKHKICAKVHRCCDSHAMVPSLTRHRLRPRLLRMCSDQLRSTGSRKVLCTSAAFSESWLPFRAIPMPVEPSTMHNEPSESSQSFNRQSLIMLFTSQWTKNQFN